MINTLYVGCLVDYFPSLSKRYAAICINYKENGEGEFPNADLQVFQPNGKIVLFKDVPYVDRNDRIGEELLKISDHWGFQHEFPVEQEAGHDPETEQGINSNAFVGEINQAN